MYWLYSDKERAAVRAKVRSLVTNLSAISGNPQADQLFPFVGRKDKRKAKEVIEMLVPENGVVVDPFAGSGSIVYAAAESGHRVIANEWEPYAYRMSTAPWRLPKDSGIDSALSDLYESISDDLNNLYRTKCLCG